MQADKAISFSGKAGDVTSIDDVARGAEGSISLPPAEALMSQKKKKTPADGMSAGKELKALIKELRKSPWAGKVFLLVALSVGVMILSVTGEVRMNEWQGSFFRAIEQKKLDDIGHQAGVFVMIMLVLLSFVVTLNWLLERLKIRLREWLSHYLLDEWMKPGVAYRLNMTSEERLNPDQRIQEDVRSFSEMSGDLGIGAARSTLMLVSFVGVLWGLSRGIALNFSGYSMIIPGYMVWFAMIYAALGSWAAARVGSPLIGLNEERYSKEATFRYSLTRISDNAESISFYSGEKDERKIVNQNLKSVLSTMKRLSFANARLTWIACGHGWLVVILPVLVALPGYLQGKLDFGGLMMVVGAFNQVQQSLRWFVDNFGLIANWRTVLHRVVVFKDALHNVDEYEDQPERIILERHAKGHLEFEKTGVSLMDGKIVISDATAEILPGERILLTGESGSGKSTLLRAVGGLWPWGSGTIHLPPADEIMFLPQKPYIPLGSLMEALAYPRTHQNFDIEEVKACLKRVNLESFIPMLDETERWDKLMSLGQQQRLAFARLLLHRPKWVFLDEATSALDDDNQHHVMSIFTDELVDSALLSIGHRTGLEQYHTRTLHLNQTHSGRVLSRKPKPSDNSKLNSNRNIIGRLKDRIVQAGATV